MSTTPVHTISAGELTYEDLGKTIALNFEDDHRAVGKLVSLQAGWFDENGELSDQDVIKDLPDLPQFKKLDKLRIGVTISFVDGLGILFLQDPEDRVEVFPSSSKV